MTPGVLSYRFIIISGRATVAIGKREPMRFCDGCAGAIGFACGVGRNYRIASAPMRDTVAKVVESRQRVGGAQKTGGKEVCEEQAERIKKLEDAVAGQAAEIDALNLLVADLFVAHVMSTGDARPLHALREYTSFAEKRAREGGTPHVPKEFFEARCAAFASVLNNVFLTELPIRYWVRSVWDWLDNRRYEANLRMQREIERLANWQSR